MQMAWVQALLGTCNDCLLQNMLEKDPLVSFKEKSPNANKMFSFERVKTLFFAQQSVRTIKGKVVASDHLYLRGKFSLPMPKALVQILTRSGSAGRTSNFFSNKIILANGAFFLQKHSSIPKKKCSFLMENKLSLRCPWGIRTALISLDCGSPL